MRILMIAPAYSPHSTRPVEWLLQRGCEVCFLDGTDPFPQKPAGYSHIRPPELPAKSYFARVSQPLATALERRFEALPLRDACRRRRIDLVHVHNVGLRAAHCAEAGLHPLVLTVWGSDINNLFLPGADSAYRRRIGRALAAADLILVDAADMIDKCTQLAGRPVAIELLPLGIDTRAFRPGYEEEARAWRRRLRIPETSVVLLSVRGLMPHYGQRVMLDAFARALARLQRDAVLVINRYGAPDRPALGPYEQELRRLAAEKQVEEHVRWMDPVPFSDMPVLYAGADVVLNHPLRDAFPVAFFEAAACGKPVISSRLPAYEGTFAEAVFQMVEAGNAEQLAEAMVHTVNACPEARWPQRRRAREIVCTQFDERITAAKLVRLYGQLIGPRETGA